jgi:prepilin-type N-terminal cleavage/methylation domain-containing protein
MRQGFSLIELLMVCGVAAIAASLAITAFGSLSASQTLSATARTVVAELRHLQTRARAEHQTLNYLLDRLPAGLTVSKPANFSFAASGLPTVGGSGTLILMNKFGRTKKIVVSSAGRIRLE